MASKARIWVCAQAQLANGDYLRLNVSYNNQPTSVVVFRYKDQHLAYRNQCVHMPRALDCEKDMIFDASGQKLRCSMHGILYDPISGESLSTICHGEKLTPVKLVEDDAGVWIFDKKIKPLISTT